MHIPYILDSAHSRVLNLFFSFISICFTKAPLVEVTGCLFSIFRLLSTSPDLHQFITGNALKGPKLPDSETRRQRRPIIGEKQAAGEEEKRKKRVTNPITRSGSSIHLVVKRASIELYRLAHNGAKRVHRGLGAVPGQRHSPGILS